MSTVQQLLDVSQQLYDHLNHSIENVDRDEYIDTITQLLDKRQSLIDNLSGEYSEEEKKLGKQIIQLNEIISQRLQEKLRFFKQELEVFQQNKRRREQYANPYKHMSIDGMYFDKKK